MQQSVPGVHPGLLAKLQYTPSEQIHIAGSCSSASGSGLHGSQSTPGVQLLCGQLLLTEAPPFTPGHKCVPFGHDGVAVGSTR